MIDSMYSVMNRINELQERFGLKRHNHTVDTVAQQTAFDNTLRNQITGAEGTNNTEYPHNLPVGGGSGLENIHQMSDNYSYMKGIPASLTRAVIETESGYDPEAVSPKGARGLMQLMPSVIRDYGVNNPFNPDENINAGTSLLQDLLKRYNNDYTKALSAYNAGPVAVDRVDGVPDYPETRDYVKKVLEKMEAFDK